MYGNVFFFHIGPLIYKWIGDNEKNRILMKGRMGINEYNVHTNEYYERR